MGSAWRTSRRERSDRPGSSRRAARSPTHFSSWCISMERLGSPRRTPATRVVVAAALIVAFACGDPYLHTNLYDPDVPVTITIAGPDTLFSVRQIAVFSAQAVLAFPDTSVQWIADTVTVFNGSRDTVVDGANYLQADGTGAFQSILPPLEPATIKVSIGALYGAVDTVVQRYLPCCGYATIKTKTYRHVAYKPIVLMQRVTRIALRCPDTHACAAQPVGGTWSVWVNGFDALGQQIVVLTGAATNPATGPPVVTYTSRDTTIAKVAPVGIRVANVTARKIGSTWIVATRGALADSLQLVVH